MIGDLIDMMIERHTECLGSWFPSIASMHEKGRG